MSDTYTVTTRTSWGARLKNSFKGIFFGIILIIGGIVLLFWNEGRTVKNKRALQEGEKAVITLSSENIEQSNEGKLVHFTGMAITNDSLKDDEFGISQLAICLERKVEMYQWKENEESTTKKNLGGSEETTTKYTYTKEWSNSLNNSENFQKPEKHKNPSEFLYPSNKVYAANVTLGAFKLPESLVHSISGSESLQLNKAAILLPKGAELNGSTIYIGKGTASDPKVGDVKITYSIIKPQQVSIVGLQKGNSVEPYVAKNGKQVLLLQSGTITADQMFKVQISSNNKMGWILRLVGFMLIFGGFGAIFKILSVIADVVPFIGRIVSFGTGLISGLLATAISLIIIAAAWIYYRPVIAFSLLGGAVIALIIVFAAGRKKKATT
jgi:hypothetical protein